MTEPTEITPLTREQYRALLEDVVRRAIHKQTERGHPMLPVLTLLTIAEQTAVTSGQGRELALTHGTFNDVVRTLVNPSIHRDYIANSGVHSLATYLVSRVIVSDARTIPAWQTYLEENAHRWNPQKAALTATTE